MTSESNSIEPGAFTEKLERASSALWDLLELCREEDCRTKLSTDDFPLLDSGFITPFEVANQYQRPTEFLQTLLDMLRVIYEPAPIGTWFLNGNLDFLLDALPDDPFRLGYATLTGDAEQPFEGFWQETVLPYVSTCGYAYEMALAVFGVVSTDAEGLDVESVSDMLSVVGAGFSVDEVLGVIASDVEGGVSQTEKTVHFGFCLDPALGRMRRLSLWLVLPLPDDSVQH